MNPDQNASIWIGKTATQRSPFEVAVGSGAMRWRRADPYNNIFASDANASYLIALNFVGFVGPADEDLEN